MRTRKFFNHLSLFCFLAALNTFPLQASAQTEPESLEEIQALAQSGDPNAMVAYALVLLDGDLVPYDAVTAAEMVNAAAATGDRPAMLLLSVMQENGVGMPANAELANALLNKVADSGLPEALFQRARNTVDVDPDAAQRDLELAGAQGYVPALQVLATYRNWSEARPSNGADTEVSIQNGGSVPSTSGPEVEKNVLIAIQAMLNSLGYKAGFPDGTLTSEATTAIVMFQIAENLPTDGQPSVELRDYIISILGRGN